MMKSQLVHAFMVPHPRQAPSTQNKLPLGRLLAAHGHCIPQLMIHVLGMLDMKGGKRLKSSSSAHHRGATLRPSYFIDWSGFVAGS